MIGKLYILLVIKVGLFNFLFKESTYAVATSVFRASFNTNAVCTYVECIIAIPLIS
jgi:hypothetical protein